MSDHLTALHGYLTGTLDGPNTRETLFGTPEAAQATYDALIDAKRSVEAQFSARKAEFETLSARTWREQDHATYHEARVAYEQWRAKAVGFHRAVETKVREAKQALREHNIEVQTRRRSPADLAALVEAGPTRDTLQALLRLYGQAVEATALLREALAGLPDDPSDEDAPAGGTEDDDESAEDAA